MFSFAFVITVNSIAIANEETNIAYSARVVGDNERARIVVDFNREPQFKIRYLAKPNRIIVDLDDTKIALGDDQLTSRGILSDIRYGIMAKDKSRIIFSLKQPAVLEDQQLQVLEGETYRLVMDISIADQNEFNAVLQEQAWEIVDAQPINKKAVVKGNRIRLTETKESDQFVLVLDAGHGGIDGGAEGRNGAIEKDITLDFVKELQQALKDINDVELLLTRDSDQFMSLSARVQIARDAEADLLISIHADSIRQRTLRGASIYTLSREASDEFASNLADSENLTDVLAGLHIENAPDDVTGILVDLARRETQGFSDVMADRIVDDFKGQIKLLNNPHRRAGFRVLLAPDVPSVLIELGFLSNLTDEKLLTDPQWRKKTTKLLAKSISDYREAVLRERE
ncbi:MAG: N-acetylmuramoyl-L-alanine amidase [Rhizobiaceae bacterium]|nr:N-acetylmuramoyl-L-alanine amidase [Rhizobiaceae bacterium]